jgi:MFS family permease
VTGLGRYLTILRTPHVGALLGSAWVGRLPVGIEGLAFVLYMRTERGSFALAGLVAGAAAAGSGVGLPVAGRLIDRLGRRRVLVPAALLHAAALLALVGLTRAGAPGGVLVVVAAVAGGSVPPLSAVLRSLWPTLLHDRPDLLRTAYALDSVAIELLFTTGPLLTAAAIALFAPAAALFLSAGLVIVGTLVFVTRPLARDFERSEDGERHPLGALQSRGLQTLVLTTLPIGFCLGSIEVTLPAFSDAQGVRELAGVLLAVWSLGSVTGGLIYGAHRTEGSSMGDYLRLSAVLPFAYVPLALAPSSFAAMLVLVIPAGAAIAPLLASTNQLVGDVAPAGARTEAYAWPVTALVAGLAAGNAAAGAIVEAADWRAAIVVAIAVGVLGGAIAFTRRGTLTPAPAQSAP